MTEGIIQQRLLLRTLLATTRPSLAFIRHKATRFLGSGTFLLVHVTDAGENGDKGADTNKKRSTTAILGDS